MLPWRNVLNDNPRRKHMKTLLALSLGFVAVSFVRDKKSSISAKLTGWMTDWLDEQVGPGVGHNCC